MILCVNPNPAVDKTLVIENFHLNAIQRPSLELALAGGKGCNVARVAKRLGHQPVVMGWVGGYAGQFIQSGLMAEGIQTAFVQTAVESRDCISIYDPANRKMTEIYEKGRRVAPEEYQAFFPIYEELLTKAQYVTLSGSLPEGLPAHFYVDLIRRAHAAGVPAALDSSGAALRLGMEEGRPAVVKCNQTELSEVLAQPLDTLEQVSNALHTLAGRLQIHVVVTLGASGAMASDGRQMWRAQSPSVDAVSPVGSGDAFLAGLVTGLVEKQSWEDALRLATACGAANTLQLGAGILNIGQVQHLLPQIQVHLQ